MDSSAHGNPYFAQKRSATGTPVSETTPRFDGSSSPIELKIGEQRELDLLKAFKKSVTADSFHFLDIEDFDIGPFWGFRNKTTKIKDFWSNGLRNFRGTFPGEKYDCEKVEVQNFLEHPKLSKSTQ